MALDPPLSRAARAARRLGVLGGSFDPPHAGHLHVARSARKALGLDHVLFVPAARPPHKPERDLAPAADRVRMLEILLEGLDWASVWTGELGREGPSYTVDTLRALASDLAGDDLAGEGEGRTELVLLLGSDNLADFPRWREVETILALARPAVVLRRGAALDVDPEGILSPAARESLTAGVLEVEPVDVSATELREALAGLGGPDRPADGSALQGLPAALVDYVRERGLYSEG